MLSPRVWLATREGLTPAVCFHFSGCYHVTRGGAFSRATGNQMLVAVAVVTGHVVTVCAIGVAFPLGAFSFAPGKRAAAEGRVALESARRPAARLVAALALALALAASFSAALKASWASEVARCLSRQVAESAFGQ